MFSYYGSKSKIIKHYPKPTTLKIREPFAGSARYSEMYWETPDIILVEKFEKVFFSLEIFTRSFRKGYT